jgi:transposase
MIDHQDNALRHHRQERAKNAAQNPLRTVSTPYYSCVDIRTCRIAQWLSRPSVPLRAAAVASGPSRHTRERQCTHEISE